MTDIVDPIPWPIADLPFFAEHGSWQESPETNVVDFPVEVGAPKRRRRSYIPSSQLRFSRTISGTQLQIFEDFFNADLKGGVYNFTAVDPRLGVTTEYTFMQTPSWRDLTSDGVETYWKLEFMLRRVNLPPAEVSP
jgi:hypothetical protein